MKIREWLFKLLFGAEWLALQNYGDVCETNRNVEKVLEQTCTKYQLSLEHPRLNNVLNRLAQLEEQCFNLRKIVKLHSRQIRPAARFQLEGGMPEAEIAQRLAGQESTPVMLAIFSHIGAKVVTLCDAATDAPRGQQTLRDGTIIPAFTAQEREHLSGQASGVAEVLAELLRLTAPQEVEAEEEKK